ncbi:putative bifunctional diguanylate cyclase/phosphodiesterase [Kineococcus radiotolerans]|uniref:putative bifunctional diguanylate cyclase/phosphodiesterase n=1 Tax=Kineococcus radiotolerans TaxID=131568 RepID=UPI000053AC90|nr:EAL domain-containing protein [Kineococcus radiotolerans]
MSGAVRERRPRASVLFDGAVTLAAVVTTVLAALAFGRDAGAGQWHDLALCVVVGLPLMQLLTRFPFQINTRHAGVEVQFDVGVLIFLLCFAAPATAALAWCLCVVPTGLLQRRSWVSRVYNASIGVLFMPVALAVLELFGTTGRAPEESRYRGLERIIRVDMTVPELLAVSAAVIAVFVVDVAVSAVSVAIQERTSVKGELLHTGAWLAVGASVAVGGLGYLGGLVESRLDRWAALLLVIPMVVTMMATRAMRTTRDVARRSEALFEAATALHTQGRRADLARALQKHARMVAGTPAAMVRSVGPAEDEIGVPVVAGDGVVLYITAPRRRDPAQRASDEKALEALASVGEAAFFRVSASEEMHGLARRDVVTGLPNRLQFAERLAQELDRAREASRLDRLVVLYLDLDGFKSVNDRFGHEAGDELLRLVGSRLRDTLRGGSTVARLGGDEFAVLLPDCQDVEGLCRRVLVALRVEVRMRGHVLRVQGSIGLSRARPGDDVGTLLRNADTAMYRAKATGKNRWVEFRPELLEEEIARLQVIEDLQQAPAEAFVVHYQPIVDLQAGPDQDPAARIVGLEALVRWRRDRGGGVEPLVGPDEFIGLAERSGTVVAIGDSVLRQVARDAASIQQHAARRLDLMVNVSPVQLRHPDFTERVAAAVRQTTSSGCRLHLEMTESVMIDDDTVGRLRDLAETGAQLTIDDFGTGFSSLGYLRHRPFSSFKIDRSFVRDIATEPTARALVEGMVKMGQALGLTIVAEGVEHPEQAEILRDMGCHLAQGHLYCRPLALEDIQGVLSGPVARPLSA